ncbi:MAG: glycosyltransferase [Clostridia bacterium]|nr:glycosyltransferase [Clostridia bacterium]
MNRIKVLHVIGGGEIGGAEIHILHLLKNLDRQIFDIRLCCLFPRPFAQAAEEAGIPVDVINMKNKFNLLAVARMIKIIKERRIDIVHTHGVRANLVGRLGAKLAGVKHIVTTVHSILEQDYPAPLARFANKVMEKLTEGYVERFVTVSDLLKKDLQTKGINPDKVVTIYNGINPEDFQSDRVATDVRGRFRIPVEVPVVGIIARMHPVKGHGVFLQAAKEVLTQLPQACFLIVGSGFHRPWVEAEAERLGLRKNVIFTGFMDDIPGVLAALDVLVISSLSEGFGLTAVEAMAMGVPVVATRVGGLPEIITHKENGLLVPAGDAGKMAKEILWLLENPVAGEAMAQKGRATVAEKFTVQGMAQQTQALYAGLMGQRRGALDA